MTELSTEIDGGSLEKRFRDFCCFYSSVYVWFLLLFRGREVKIINILKFLYVFNSFDRIAIYNDIKRREASYTYVRACFVIYLTSCTSP